MKLKNRAFDVLQNIFIALAVIGIVVVVVFKIINGQLANETAHSEAYNALVSLRDEVVGAITWIGIVVTVIIGFALIRMMTNK